MCHMMWARLGPTLMWTLLSLQGARKEPTAAPPTFLALLMVLLRCPCHARHPLGPSPSPPTDEPLVDVYGDDGGSLSGFVPPSRPDRYPDGRPLPPLVLAMYDRAKEPRLSGTRRTVVDLPTFK